MPIRRFLFVQGTGRRKHVLRDGDTDTICGAWYFGKVSGNPQQYPPNAKAKHCKHCDRLAVK